MINNFDNKLNLTRFSIYDDYLDKKSDEVLDNDYFHSNITLSRNHLIGSELLQNLTSNSNVKINFILIIKNVLLFYARNIIYFSVWILYFIIARIGSIKNFYFHKKIVNNNIFLIQTFVDKNSIKYKSKIEDNYFRELYEYLDRNNKEYFILPNISEDITNVKERINIINFISKPSNIYKTEFNSLTVLDLFRIMGFILFYPIILLRYCITIKKESKIDYLYQHDLIYTLSKSSFIPYVQLLFGKRLKEEFKNKVVKIISWNENQLIHRNFCRGISSENITVYGCQYFIKYPSCKWMYIRENDKKFNVLPDIILVTGKKYLPLSGSLEYRIGSPFRYRDVHNKDKQANTLDQVCILVMLPYEQIQSESILDFIYSSKYLRELKLDIKIHPDYVHRKNFYMKRISKKWKIVDNNLDFTKYNMLIAKSTGSIIEFIAKGFSVLVIDDDNPLALNPLEKHGRKIIWDYIKNSNEFSHKINLLSESRKKSLDKILKISDQFKSDYFNEVTEKNLKQDFNF